MAAMMQQMMNNPAMMQQSMLMAQQMFGGAAVGQPNMFGAPAFAPQAVQPAGEALDPPHKAPPMLSYVCGLRLIWLSYQRWAFAMKPLACALYNSIMAALMLQSTLSWQTGTVLLEVRIKRLGNATRFVFATYAIHFLL